MTSIAVRKNVNIPNGTGTIVDLTVLLAEELPCSWSSHMPFQQKTFNYFKTEESTETFLYNRTGPYQTRFLVIDEHTGTHFDAPAHFIPEEGSGITHEGPAGDVTAEKVPLDQMMGPAVVIDIPEDLPGTEMGVSGYIQPEAVLEHEEKHGKIQPGDIVLFRSGWDRHYKAGADGNPYCYDPLITGEGLGWPAPDVPVMELLMERGVRCVGIDSPSMGSTHNGPPVHVAALKTGAVFLEGLANLKELPNTGAWFCFAPIFLKRGTGAPGRAFAIIPD